MRHRWTDEQVALLRKMQSDGTNGRGIAEALQKMSGLHVTMNAITHKARRLGLHVRELTAEPDAARGEPKLRESAADRRAKEREQRSHERLVERFQQMIQTHDTPVVQYHGTSLKFGAVSDTHYGSLWERPDLAQKAYQIMHREGIRDVFHVGDFLEGSGMRHGHEHELSVVGADNQVAHAHDKHPEIKGMQTYFILGRHDLSFHKNAGHNVGERLATRDDLTYLGGTTATVPLKVGGTLLRMQLEHPGKGSSYALSYQPQKIIEALPGGRKPEVMLIGHFHKALYMPVYRNVLCFMAGCLESQTDWMREHAIEAHLGFWMVEIRATKAGIARCKGEFVPFYEV